MLIDIKAYGAVGDGSTDDTAAIQSAIDACVTNDVLKVPASYYLTTNDLVVDKDITILGDSEFGSFIVNNAGCTVINAARSTKGQAIAIKDLGIIGGSSTPQTLINVGNCTNVVTENLYLNTPYKAIEYGENINFLMVNQMRIETAGGSEAIRIKSGGGCISNVFARKGRTAGNTGPTLHMTGQITGLQIANCGFSGIGTPWSSILASIVNNGTSFTCTMNAGTPHNFGIAGELAVINGTGTGYDNVWIISSVASNLQFTVTATTGLGNYTAGTAKCYKPECSVYMSNAGTGAVNETNWSNIILESVDTKSVGSFALYLDTIPGPYAVADHNFNNCLYDSGESVIAIMGKGFAGQFINNINMVGGEMRYTRYLAYQAAAANVQAHSMTLQNSSTSTGYQV